MIWFIIVNLNTVKGLITYPKLLRIKHRFILTYKK